MHIAIAGGGVAGLSAALLLAGDGHDVVVLDRDPLSPARDVEAAAAAAFRPAAPQIVHPHALLPRGQALLRDRFGSVLKRLLGAGAEESPLRDQLPAALAATVPSPGDDDLTMIMTRRSTFDWSLLHAAAEQPRVGLRGGVRVTGLLTEPDSPPRVRGLATTAGTVAADVVLDATGRRSPIDGWLVRAGAHRSVQLSAECGLAYFSRHYRRRTGASVPGRRTVRILLGLDEFTTGLWTADNDTMLFAVAPLAVDRRFRRIRDPDVFAAVLRTVPQYAQWLDVLEPIGPVHAMAGLHNTFRRSTVAGQPAVAGLYAVGDSACTTNPTFGRGMTLALQGAADLADVLRERLDPVETAAELDRRVDAHLLPYYLDQTRNDASRLAALRHAVLAAPSPPPPAPQLDRVELPQLRAAAQIDPVLCRRLFRLLGMLEQPVTVYRDPDVIARVEQVLGRRAPQPRLPQPTRDQLCRALR